MAHAEKCPVCKGYGTALTKSAHSGDVFLQVCHGCNGKGWVEVNDLPYPMTFIPPTFPDSLGDTVHICGKDC